MPELNIGTWLLQQAPTVVILGIAVYFLWKELNKERQRNNNLSEDVIKISLLWETKASDLGTAGSKDRETILRILREIRSLVQKK